MDIDLRTLYVVHALVSLTLAALMAVFWRINRIIPGVGLWALGSALLGLTILGGALRGAISDVLSIVVANFIGVVSLGAYWNGIRRFDDRPARWGVVLAAAFATAAFVTHHTYVIDDILMRIIVVSLVLGTACGLCCFELVRGPGRTLRGSALTAAGLFGVVGILLYLRALSTWLTPPEPSLFARTPAQSAHLLVSTVGTIMVSVALLMMATQRLQRSLAARNAELEAALATAEARSRELAQSRQQLAAAQRLEAMGQMTGGVAHDFNNLLTVIAGAVEMMTRGARDWARVEKLSAVALRAVLRGQRLTQSLLTFARRDLVRPERVQPDQLVAEVEPLLRRAVGEQVAVSVDLGAGIPAVSIDPSPFEVALLNLVLNARDAMPVGGGRIVIEVRAVDLDPDYVRRNPEARPGRHVVIAVDDDGMGMPAEVLAQAFEPFFSTKDIGKGSGLGLSQVYGFARGANGHVTIDSRVGEGTTVRLYLPVADETAASDAALAS